MPVLNQIPKISRIITWVILGYLTVVDSKATITLDGLLDEAEWTDAQVFNTFTLVNPFILSKPEFSTEIRVFSDPSGLYFGIKNNQPLATRNNDTTARDQNIGSDKNEIIIDFDGNKITAYSFQVGSGSSIRDGIYSNETNFSSEWDGNWQAKTSSNSAYWVSEVFIPWDIVSMKKNSSEQRTVNWHVSRNVASQNHTYAISPINRDKQRFISEFSPLTINNYTASSLQLFGYAAVRNDFINDDLSQDIGADIFWKSGQGKQLSLTINPDFGQVESDNLVVNFEPTEVFFNERRSFFTENQSLFDVRGAQTLRLLNTRRIGSRPDVGLANASDIDGAIKFTNTNNNFNYGLFAASESSGNDFEGRNFLAGRYIHHTENQNLGFLTTHTDRSDLDRTATVTAVDHNYLLNNGLRFSSLIVMTDVEQGEKGIRDWGAYFKVNHQISPTANQQLEFSHYGDEFEVQDFGYLRRNDLETLSYSNSYKFNDFKANNKTQEHEFRVNLDLKRNNQHQMLPGYFRFLDIWRFKDSSSLNWYIEYLSTGKDDLISRGNGLLNTDAGYTASVTYFSKNSGKFRNHGYLDYTDTYLGGKGYSAHIHPSYYFQDNYSISWGIYYTDTKNWINWQNDNLFGSYHRKFLNNRLDFNANISQRQELRLRFQWIAIDAKAEQQLQLNNRGNLTPTDNNIKDFNISNTALQLRYRYEISPLSNIYIAYSRGGEFFSEDDGSLIGLFNNGLNNVTGNNFLIKVRYNLF